MEKITSFKTNSLKQSHHVPWGSLGIPNSTEWPQGDALQRRGGRTASTIVLPWRRGVAGCELRVDSVGLMGLLKYFWPQILDLQVFFCLSLHPHLPNLDLQVPKVCPFARNPLESNAEDPSTKKCGRQGIEKGWYGHPTISRESL